MIKFMRNLDWLVCNHSFTGSYHKDSKLRLLVRFDNIEETLNLIIKDEFPLASITQDRRRGDIFI